MAQRRPEVSDIVFVVGFPRSGTTWFSNLINSHPDAVYRHEVFGREYESFGESLFKSLKNNNGLTDDEFEVALRVLLRARISTDKPPFFKKNYHKIASVSLQRMMWLAAKTAQALEPVYTFLFTPSSRAKVTLVIKETRSSVNLDSIVSGIRTSKLLVLVRHPYAVIASHLKGRESGLMGGGNDKKRHQWFDANQSSAYVSENRIERGAVINMPEVEFLALSWRVQNEDYLRMHASHNDSQVLIYEEFLDDPLARTEGLIGSLGLSLDKQVIDFVAESSSTATKKNLLEKDSSTEFFSVYRGKGFDPNKWKKVLSPEDVELVDKHSLELVEKLGLSAWSGK